MFKASYSFCIAVSSILNVSAVAAQETVSLEWDPERVLTSYLKVVVNRDVNSASQLNNYLQPRFNGANVFDLNTVTTQRTLEDPVLQRTLNAYLTSLAKSVSSSEFAQFKTQYTESLNLQVKLLQNANCKVLGEPIAREAIGRSSLIFNYECRMLKVNFEKLPNSKAVGGLTMEESLAFQQRRHKALLNARGERIIKAEATLYAHKVSTPREYVIWYLDSPDSLLVPLLRDGLGL